MLILLSPAKTLNEKFPIFPPGAEKIAEAFTEPVFFEQTKKIVGELQQKSPEQIGQLMHVSEKIADLNVGRYHSFPQSLNQNNSYPALSCFMGDVYKPINNDFFSLQEWELAQKQVRILSGLYGLIRPLDLMYPYRLEMGTKLKLSEETLNTKNLYEFWGDKITDRINDHCEKQGIKTIVNLASQEYFKSVKPKKLSAQLISIDFKNHNKKGELKTIAIYAKKARGLMTNWVIQNNISEVEDLKKFPDYVYQPTTSTDSNWVFVA
jgi:cytoplasmic iron level regulating protein YaaA (DUF328/UPF0246 family)